MRGRAAWLGGLLTGLGLVFLCACSQQVVQDASRLRVLDQGIDAYTRALTTEDRDARLAAFAEAQRLFATAARDGGSAELYVNLGNAALGAGDLGAAVLAYRRALVVDPDHTRALQNLAHARRQLPAWVPRSESVGVLDSFFFWQRSLSRSERWVISGIALLLAAGLIAGSWVSGLSLLRNLAWLPGGLWLVVLGSLVFDPALETERDVVVTAPEIEARAADSAVAPVLFSAPLPGGTEARVLEERSPWMRVRLANGRDVWLNGSALTRVIAPSSS